MVGNHSKILNLLEDKQLAKAKQGNLTNSKLINKNKHKFKKTTQGNSKNSKKRKG